MMVTGFVTLVFLFCVVESRILLEVAPKTIEPGLTSEMRLSCNVDQYEKRQIVSFSIFRNTLNARKGNVSPNETIVEMRGPDPIEITIAAGYEKLNASGRMPVSQEEISRRQTELWDEYPRNWTEENNREWSIKEAKIEEGSLESERGPALFVVWPEPGVEDLGVYTCEVIFSEVNTEQPWSATATLTASLKYLDQLLVNVLGIEKEAQVFNQTLTGVQAELYNIRKDLDELQKARYEASRHATPVQVNDTEAEIWLNETATDGPTQAGEPGPELQRLTRALENLEANFYKFNEVLERVDKLIAALEDKVDEEWPENKTTAAQVDDWSLNKTSDVQVEERPVNQTRYDEEVKITGTTDVEQGSKIQLQCRATGGLQIPEEIEWFQDGYKISWSENKDYKISTYRYNEQRALVSTLQVNRAYADHAGTYVCRSSNMKIDSIHVTVLRVQTPVHKTSEVEEVKLTGTTYVEQGSQIQLQCKATGGLHIAEKIDWFKGCKVGIDMKSSDKFCDGYKISWSENKDYVISTYRSNEQGALVSTLQVDRAYADHAGTYVCRSSNLKIDSIRVTVLRVQTPVHKTREVKEEYWEVIN